MSDYNPGPGGYGSYDKYGNSNLPPGDPGGRGPYILLGILVAIGLIGGLLYFNGTPKDRSNQAQAPMGTERPTTGATTPGTPSPATPSPSATPSDTQKQ